MNPTKLRPLATGSKTAVPRRMYPDPSTVCARQGLRIWPKQGQPKTKSRPIWRIQIRRRHRFTPRANRSKLADSGFEKLGKLSNFPQKLDRQED